MTAALPRILLVDEDPDVCAALAFSLEVEGFAVEIHGPETLLDRIDLGPSSCLVVDLCAPEMSGLDLLDTLRAKGVRQPAVLLATCPTSAVRARAHAAGADIVEKPLLCDALVDAVRKARPAHRPTACP